MTGTLNQVTLIGNLGRDPEVRTFQNGGKVMNLRLATSQQWKDRQSGEKRERTEWHSVAVFQEGGIKFLENNARKGTKVMVIGQLETRKWQDQSGQDRYSTEVAVRPYVGQVQIMGGWANDEPGGGGGGDYGGQGMGGNGGYTSGDQRTPAGGQYTGGDMDDEIPF